MAYVAVSLLARARGRRVGAAAAVALAVGSQFPDLVDKPLAWSLAVLPTGTTLAHSVFVAVPVCLLAWSLGHRYGRAAVGRAFAAGYALHLPGDIVYGSLTAGRPLSVDPLLWPLVAKAETGAPAGLLSEVLFYVGRYREFLARPEAVGYLAVEVVLLSAAAVLWATDGYPGLDSLLAGRGRPGR